MAETLQKTVSASEVIGFAQLTGDRIRSISRSAWSRAPPSRRTTLKNPIADGLYTASLPRAGEDRRYGVTVTVAEPMPNKSPVVGAECHSCKARNSNGLLEPTRIVRHRRKHRADARRTGAALLLGAPRRACRAPPPRACSHPEADQPEA